MTQETRKSLLVNKKRSHRSRSRLAISLLIVLLAAIGISLWQTQNYLWRIPSSLNNSPARALLLDQLSLNYPNPAFVTNVTNALTAGGYQTDYVGPTTDAVEFFRQLPMKAYDLIIIRAHSGADQSIITTETYSQTRYITDQRAGTIVAAEVGGLPLFFALTPKFVRQDMEGRFHGTTIVVMGCAALQGTQDLASAFLDKGANYFVGWDGSVTIIHTDVSTVMLTQQLASGKSVPEATSIAGTADPVYGARLEYLDWNTLVHGRIDNFVSQIALWITVVSLLVLGPLAVFVAPKLFDALDRSRQKAWHGKKATRRRSNPKDPNPQS